MALALAGACPGLLRYYLAKPSRVFLGDAGSVTVGFVIAGPGMTVGRQQQILGASLFAAALIAGTVIVDTTPVRVYEQELAR